MDLVLRLSKRLCEILRYAQNDTIAVEKEIWVDIYIIANFFLLVEKIFSPCRDKCFYLPILLLKQSGIAKKRVCLTKEFYIAEVRQDVFVKTLEA